MPVWRCGGTATGSQHARAPTSWSGCGRSLSGRREQKPEASEGRREKRGPARTVHHNGEHTLVCVAELVLCQVGNARTGITWRNGDGQQRRGQFGLMRVQPTSGHCKGMPPEPE